MQEVCHYSELSSHRQDLNWASWLEIRSVVTKDCFGEL